MVLVLYVCIIREVEWDGLGFSPVYMYLDFSLRSEVYVMVSAAGVVSFYLSTCLGTYLGIQVSVLIITISSATWLASVREWEWAVLWAHGSCFVSQLQ